MKGIYSILNSIHCETDFCPLRSLALPSHAAMATGSFVRVVAIAGSGARLLGGGVLDERTAALGMIAGFLAEMIIAWRSVLRLERDHPGTAG